MLEKVVVTVIAVIMVLLVVALLRALKRIKSQDEVNEHVTKKRESVIEQLRGNIKGLQALNVEHSINLTRQEGNFCALYAFVKTLQIDVETDPKMMVADVKARLENIPEEKRQDKRNIFSEVGQRCPKTGKMEVVIRKSRTGWHSDGNATLNTEWGTLNTEWGLSTYIPSVEGEENETLKKKGVE